jgi:hypothetical protein
VNELIQKHRSDLSHARHQYANANQARKHSDKLLSQYERELHLYRPRVHYSHTLSKLKRFRSLFSESADELSAAAPTSSEDSDGLIDDDESVSTGAAALASLTSDGQETEMAEPDKFWSAQSSNDAGFWNSQSDAEDNGDSNKFWNGQSTNAAGFWNSQADGGDANKFWNGQSTNAAGFWNSQADAEKKGDAKPSAQAKNPSSDFWNSRAEGDSKQRTARKANPAGDFWNSRAASADATQDKSASGWWNTNNEEDDNKQEEAAEKEESQEEGAEAEDSSEESSSKRSNEEENAEDAEDALPVLSQKDRDQMKQKMDELTEISDKLAKNEKEAEELVSILKQEMAVAHERAQAQAQAHADEANKAASAAIDKSKQEQGTVLAPTAVKDSAGATVTVEAAPYTIGEDSSEAF